MELLDESRGNCISGNSRIRSSISTTTETRFSENHPGAVSTSSSLPHMSRCQFVCMPNTTLMMTVSMIFLVRMSSNAEGIPKRGSSSAHTTVSVTLKNREMCFRVRIDGRNMSARRCLTLHEPQTITEQAIKNFDDYGEDITYKRRLH
jgi:hypothetical protein